jgi:biopolymer transport protein ExbD
VVHGWPHIPQFASSDWVSTHVPAQSTFGATHGDATTWSSAALASLGVPASWAFGPGVPQHGSPRNTATTAKRSATRTMPLCIAMRDPRTQASRLSQRKETAMAERDDLSAAQRGSVRRRARPGEHSPDKEGGELNVVPFLDIMMNVLMFVLATVALAFTAIIDVKPPHHGTTAAPALTLNVLVLREGFVVSAMGRRLGPGCTGEGRGLAVGMKSDGSGYDFAALTECVTRLKALAPDYADERQAVVAANDDVRFDAIVGTLDAIRRKDGVDLFPDVSFGVPR